MKMKGFQQRECGHCNYPSHAWAIYCILHLFVTFDCHLSSLHVYFLYDCTFIPIIVTSKFRGFTMTYLSLLLIITGHHFTRTVSGATTSSSNSSFCHAVFGGLLTQLSTRVLVHAQRYWLVYKSGDWVTYKILLARKLIHFLHRVGNCTGMLAELTFSPRWNNTPQCRDVAGFVLWPPRPVRGRCR